MNGILGGGLPPGLSGFVAAEEMGQRRKAQGLQGAIGILNMQNMMQEMDDRATMRPLQQEKLRMSVEQERQNIALRGALQGQLSGGPATPQGALAAGAAQGDVGPTVTNAGRIGMLNGPGGGGGMMAGVNPMAAALALSGDAGMGKLGGMIQEANKPLAAREGAPVINPATGQIMFYAPKLETGMMPQFSGGQITGVNNIPGFVPAMTERTTAAEGAKAGFDLVSVPTPGGGTQMMPRSEAVRSLGPQGPAIPSGPTPGALQQSMMIPPAVQAGRDAEAGRIRAAEGQPGGGGMIPSASVLGRAQGTEQKAASETSGRETAQLVSGYRQKIPALNTTLRRLDMLERLNVDDTTYAAAGAEVKTMLGSIAQGFGLEVAKDKTANSELYLAQIGELMKDRLASKDYGSGSGVSNLDLLAARQPLPELAKTQQGRAALIQAIRADTQASAQDLSAAVQHFDRNLSLSGFQYPSSAGRETRGGDLDTTVRTERPRPAAARPTGRVVKWNEL